MPPEDSIRQRLEKAEQEKEAAETQDWIPKHYQYCQRLWPSAFHGVCEGTSAGERWVQKDPRVIRNVFLVGQLTGNFPFAGFQKSTANQKSLWTISRNCTSANIAAPIFYAQFIDMLRLSVPSAVYDMEKVKKGLLEIAAGASVLGDLERLNYYSDQLKQQVLL